MSHWSLYLKWYFLWTSLWLPFLGTREREMHSSFRELGGHFDTACILGQNQIQCGLQGFPHETPAVTWATSGCSHLAPKWWYLHWPWAMQVLERVPTYQCIFVLSILLHGASLSVKFSFQFFFQLSSGNALLFFFCYLPMVKISMLFLSLFFLFLWKSAFCLLSHTFSFLFSFK